MNLKISQFEFPTFQHAWQGLNEYMANNQREIESKGGGVYSSQMVIYDTVIHVFKSWVDPEFDFGRVLGYRNKKWSKLINNYVNFDYLDLVKSEVNRREKRGGRSCHYTYTYHFDNSHGSGKDCLIALTFCRRKGQENPYVIYNTRASEITSRMIFDFLLIQRMVEYVYGKGVTVEVVCYIPFMFLNLERFLMYMSWAGEDKLVIDKKLGPTRYQTNMLKRLDYFNNTPLENIKYKIYKRIGAQIKKDKKGNPLANAPKLLAKDLSFPYNPKLKTDDIKKLNKDLKKTIK